MKDRDAGKNMSVGTAPEIRVAETAGFCFGVKRAVDILEKTIAENPDKPIFTYGPIIHNDEVVKEFEAKGVKPYEEDKALPDADGIMVLRSHGLSRKKIGAIEEKRLTPVDATCPFVKKIHDIVSEHSKNGEFIIILGDEEHPEVEGITGWINGKAGEDYAVVSSAEEAERLSLPKDRRLCIVSQTTERADKFQNLVEMLTQKGYDTYAQNTVCSATALRQKEAAALSEWADVMLVIGGKHSSNSRKLFDICSSRCQRTFFLQTKEDLDTGTLQSISRIGITAGASTPENIIEEVLKKCQTTSLQACSTSMQKPSEMERS